ncbi:MAG: hypothetical protein ABI234_03735 [Ktedonobacteraceae bacterium]
MDITSPFVSVVIGGICTLAGAFGAIYLTHWFDRKKEQETKYIGKIEEIGAYMPQLRRWYQEEARMYWHYDTTAPEAIYDPRLNKYNCPFYEIENLVNWWIHSLSKHVQEIGKVVSFFEYLRGYEGVDEYTSAGNMDKLESDLREYGKIFDENYDYIQIKIREAAKKVVANR